MIKETYVSKSHQTEEYINFAYIVIVEKTISLLSIFYTSW